MQSYTLLAPAKINLLLEIIGDRTDGFHELVMVMQTVDLADIIELHHQGGNRITLHCNHPQVPLDATNLAHRAAQLMIRRFPGHGGVDITIEKKIPIGAGLAGGSTNAAAVLVGLDLMWNLGLTQGELQTLGAELGSDVPFCIAGGTALALGRGEELTSLLDITNLYAVLAKFKSLSVSTPWAYQTYRAQYQDSYANTQDAQEHRRRTGPSVPLLTALEARNYEQLGRCLYNDLERVVLPHEPRVAELKTVMEQFEPLGVMMSGSGPTVFALTTTRAEAEAIAQQTQAAIADPDLAVWATQCSPMGIQVLQHQPK
jgi:4-diphosphocytidyl-2-C-methyl-D-erythritol kinase